MIQTIGLRGILPAPLSGKSFAPSSDVWCNSLDLVRGSYTLIEASSGRGKTSLCSFLYGTRGDYSGEIYFDDKSLRSISPREWATLRRHHLAILWQDLGLFAKLTARENILVKNQLTGYASSQQVDRWIELVGLGEHRDRPVGLMSLGQQQRVALLRALCQPYDFILLDEPVSHLDQTNALLIAELVASEARHQGAGIIATSVGVELPLEYTQHLSL